MKRRARRRSGCPAGSRWKVVHSGGGKKSCHRTKKGALDSQSKKKGDRLLKLCRTRKKKAA